MTEIEDSIRIVMGSRSSGITLASLLMFFEPNDQRRAVEAIDAMVDAGVLHFDGSRYEATS